MMENKTHFATKKALQSKTPEWAKNMFRITMLVTSAVVFFIAGTNLVDESIKYEVTLALKAIDPLVWGISKLFGIEKEGEDA